MYLAHINRPAETGTFYSALEKAYQEAIQNPEAKPQTQRTYGPRFQQVKSYLTKNNLLHMAAHEWTAERFKHFCSWMAGNGYCNETIRKTQNLIYKAIQPLFYQENIQPPAKVKLKRKTLPLVYLNAEEIELLVNHKFASEKLARVRDLFLVQCFSGVSYADLSKLNKRNLRQIEGMKVIQGIRQKCGTVFTVPLLSELEEILNRYRWELPVLSNAKYNAYLKEVAVIVGIDKPLRSHDGRRTCAMYYLNMTGSMEVCAAILGHTDTRQTAKTYARYFPEHLIRAIKGSEIFRKTG